jgi:hypothetical protein
MPLSALLASHKRDSRYSIDAICIGYRTPPMTTPTKNVAASKRLHRNFLAVQAFAFACPRVPGRIGSFLKVPIPNETQLCSIGNAAKRPLFH